jgi:hypothetical protein
MIRLKVETRLLQTGNELVNLFLNVFNTAHMTNPQINTPTKLRIINGSAERLQIELVMTEISS